MTTLSLTDHARTRMQQRSLPPVVIEWLDEFGDEEFDGRGGVVSYFSKDSKRRLERRYGRRFIAQNAQYLDRYAIRSADDGALITVGIRTNPIRRR